MPRDLFGDVVHASMTIASRKWYTLPLSVIVHALLITTRRRCSTACLCPWR